jgi:hypothetical protein
MPGIGGLESGYRRLRGANARGNLRLSQSGRRPRFEHFVEEDKFLSELVVLPPDAGSRQSSRLE